MFMLDCLRPVERQWRDLLLLVWKIIRHYDILADIYHQLSIFSYSEILL